MTQELSAIVAQMEKLRNQKKDLDKEEKILWYRFFEICDDIAGPGQSYRFIHPDLELAIAREMHQATPTLNIEALKDSLNEEQWKAITRQEHVFDIIKLEIAVANGLLSKELVEQFTELRQPVAHKKFGPTTKKDLEDEN